MQDYENEPKASENELVLPTDGTNAFDQGSITEKRKTFGAMLRAKRCELGHSPRDVIHLTRISPPFLDALEEGRFEALPGAVFGRGFVKNICKAMEADSAELLIAYDECWTDQAVKAKNYSYSGRLISGSRKKDYKSKKLIPFSNYLSPKGLILWLGAPVVAVAVGGLGFLIWQKIPILPAPEAQNLGQTTEPFNGEKLDSKAALADSETTVSNENLKNDHLDQKRPSEPDQVSNNSKSEMKEDLPSDSEANMPGTETPIAILAKDINESQNEKTEYTKVFIEVRETVKIRYRLDNEIYEEKPYQPGLYKFGFTNKFDFFCDDTSKIEVTYKGRSLGDFGIHRNSKQLSFLADELPITAKF